MNEPSWQTSFTRPSENCLSAAGKASFLASLHNAYYAWRNWILWGAGMWMPETERFSHLHTPSVPNCKTFCLF